MSEVCQVGVNEWNVIVIEMMKASPPVTLLTPTSRVKSRVNEPRTVSCCNRLFYINIIIIFVCGGGGGLR